MLDKIQLLAFAAEETDDHESEKDADEWVLPDTTSQREGGETAAGNGGGSSCRAGGGAADAGSVQAVTHVHSSS